MTYVLDPRGCVAKFRRAIEHKDALEASIDAAQRAHTIDATTVSRFDAASGHYVERIIALPDDLLSTCGVLIGDCIHNLRSSLDHLAWQLALVASDGRPPPNPTQIAFPVYRFARKKGRRRGLNQAEVIKQVGAAHRKLLANFQPYRGGHGKRLAALNRLWNVDKHRTLVRIRLGTTAWHQFDLPIAISDPDISRVGKWADIGKEVMRFRIHQLPDGAADIPGRFSAEIHLDGLGPPVQALEELIESVRAVLTSFDISVRRAND